MKSANEYRALAREQLGGSPFGNTWLYAVLIALVYAAVGSLLGVTGFGVFLMFLIEGFFMTGVAVISMKLVHGGKEIDFNDLLFAKDRVGAAMLLGLMRNLFILLWTLLFIVPGIIKRYAYSQSYYLFAEHPEWEWKTCLAESEKMMRGKKWNLFCLDLSFLGWWIVGALCLGIGTLWVIPYHIMARADFYEDLSREPVVG